MLIWCGVSLSGDQAANDLNVVSPWVDRFERGVSLGGNRAVNDQNVLSPWVEIGLLMIRTWCLLG